MKPVVKPVNRCDRIMNVMKHHHRIAVAHIHKTRDIHMEFVKDVIESVVMKDKVEIVNENVDMEVLEDK